MPTASHILFTADGFDLRSERLCAWDQHCILTTVAPIFSRLSLGRAFGQDMGQAAMRALANLADDEVTRIFDATLKGVEVYEGETWHPFWSVERQEAEIPDCELSTVVAVAYAAAQEQLRTFFEYEVTKFDQRGSEAASFEPVRMAEGRSFLLQPIQRGFYRMTDLFDGTLDLWQIAMAHDCMAVDAENEGRARKAAEEGRGRR